MVSLGFKSRENMILSLIVSQVFGVGGERKMTRGFVPQTHESFSTNFVVQIQGKMLPM